MLIQFTLCGLIILLIAVIALSYYANKEGFDNITVSLLQNEKPATISLDKLQQLFNSIGCAKKLTEEDVKWWRTRPTMNDIVNDMKAYADLTSKCAGSEGQHSFCDPTKCKKSQAIVPSTPAPAPTSSPVSTPSPVSTTPQRNVVVPQVSISDTGYNAMELQQKTDLLKDIQKIVKNEILANRMTTTMFKEKEKEKEKDKIFSADDSEESDCTMQGKEYESQKNKGEEEYRCPKNPDGSCPPVPDMSQYIKKDAIPCWGCSLQY